MKKYNLRIMYATATSSNLSVARYYNKMVEADSLTINNGVYKFFKEICKKTNSGYGGDELINELIAVYPINLTIIESIEEIKTN